MTSSGTDVAAHYGTTGLLDRILAALTQAGKDVSKLTIDDLALVDEFHSRRRRATEELARMLAHRGGPRDRCRVGHRRAVAVFGGHVWLPRQRR